LSSEIIDIADAIVAELNDHSFSVSFVSTREYAPEFELKELAELKVTVVPRGLERNIAGRGSRQNDYQVDIAIQKRVANNDDCDNLMGLVQEIVEYLDDKTLSDYPTARWFKTNNDPIFAPDHIQDKRCFTSILTLAYRVLT